MSTAMEWTQVGVAGLSPIAVAVVAIYTIHRQATTQGQAQQREDVIRSQEHERALQREFEAFRRGSYENVLARIDEVEDALDLVEREHPEQRPVDLGRAIGVPLMHWRRSIELLPEGEETATLFRAWRLCTNVGHLPAFPTEIVRNALRLARIVSSAVLRRETPRHESSIKYMESLDGYARSNELDSHGGGSSTPPFEIGLEFAKREFVPEGSSYHFFGFQDLGRAGESSS